jgi:signal-transduction protein with cAMP-binding, CBS, and nucleotidyltransferase domain
MEQFSFVRNMPTVKDIATKSILSIDAGETVVEAAKVMKNNGRGSLIIFEGTKARGIITETDVIRRVLAENLPNTTRVGQVMSKPLITIDADMDIKDAAKFMLFKKIRRLPIDENGKLISIITSNDLLHYLSRRTLSERFWDFITSHTD